MIVEALFNVFKAFVVFVIGLFPTGNAPTWITTANGYFSQIWGYGAGLGAWIPWPVVGQVFSAVLVAVALGLGIKIARVVFSMFTGGGGSAA